MYPILKYARDQSSDVLLKHEATENEKSLFKTMDSAVVALADDAEIERCYEVIIPIGREAGLDEKDSIAFWTRMTFSEFEPSLSEQQDAAELSMGCAHFGKSVEATG